MWSKGGDSIKLTFEILNKAAKALTVSLIIHSNGHWEQKVGGRNTFFSIIGAEHQG